MPTETTTATTLAMAPAMAPATGTHTTKSIVVPLDGSSFSRAALTVAKEFADAFDATVVLLLVVTDEFERMVDRFAKIEHLTPEQAGDAYLLRTANDAFPGPNNTEIRREVRTASDPAKEILAALDDFENPMVVMSSHGHTGVRQLVLGSVTQNVLHDATVPVVVVRPTETINKRSSV